MFDSSVEHAAWFARYYRGRHRWNPLPSRTDVKAPIGCYAQYWDSPVEEMIFSRWPSPNIQLMTGVRWNLAVVDLDGSAALDTWRAMTLYRPSPRTWMVRTGSGGLHLWYLIPASVKELPSKRLWIGDGSHSGIEVLGDRKLVVAPPSIHVDTGRPYRFEVGPAQLSEPALMPLWLARMPDVSRRPEPEPLGTVPPLSTVDSGTGSGTFDRQQVLRAIRDKLGLVRRWGLRVIGWKPNRDGWLVCRAIGRDDRNPSAGFNVKSGYYSEPPQFRMSLFDLAVHLRVFPSWQDAVNGLGSRYGAKS